VTIDRIVLRAGEMEPRVAKRLAEQVAAGLERSTLAGDLPQRAELVRLQVRPAPGASMDQLTQMIVAESCESFAGADTDAGHTSRSIHRVHLGISGAHSQHHSVSYNPET